MSEGALTKDSIKYIIERVLDNARDAMRDSSENPNDDFYAGKKLAYYEILDSMRNELIIDDADLREFGIEESPEYLFK